VHSLIAVPVVVDGQVEATIMLSRNAPGAPFSTEDLEFATALGAALRVALARAAAYRTGWRRRRDLVHAIAQRLRDGDDMSLDDVLHEGTLAEIVDDLDGHLVTNQAAVRLAEGDASVLVDGFAADDAVTTRLQRGELEYHDDEHDVTLADGTVRRFIVHRGLVRDDAARPRVLVVVAQPFPAACA
jgi:GAF domain-containing protein